MNKIIIIAIFIALCGLGWYVFVTKDRSGDANSIDVGALNETTNLVSRDDLNLEFRYPNKAYSMLSAPLGDALANTSLKESFVVVNTAAYEAVKGNSSTELPPLFTITVFNSPDDESVDGATTTEYVSRTDRLKEWAMQYKGLTNIDGQMVEVITDADIDGVSGITYTTEGLYKNKTYILTYHDFIYLIIIQSSGDAENDAAFKTVFDSITFQ